MPVVRRHRDEARCRARRACASRAAKRPAAGTAEGAAPEPTRAAATAEVTLQSQWLRAVRHVLASTEDVGERFPEEARRIHYGEVEERSIRGRASREDAEALREEGIEVTRLADARRAQGPGPVTPPCACAGIQQQVA